MSRLEEPVSLDSWCLFPCLSAARTAHITHSGCDADWNDVAGTLLEPAIPDLVEDATLSQGEGAAKPDEPRSAATQRDELVVGWDPLLSLHVEAQDCAVLVLTVMW